MPQVQHVVQSQSNSHILKPVIIEVTHPCPKCGQYFGSVSGLHQHIHRRHPELELQARVNFDRSKHCLYGVPICRFCNHRSSNWQALRKHLSQGMCLAIKTVIAEGRTITDLENEIAQARPSETTAPPQENWIQEEPLAVSDHAMLQIPTHELDTQAVAIRRYTNQCMLCGQRIVNSKHMKTHWRTGHPDAWKKVRAHSEALAGSLSTIVRKPCQFCGSKAKNSQAHSRQCSQTSTATSSANVNICLHTADSAQTGQDATEVPDLHATHPGGTPRQSRDLTQRAFRTSGRRQCVINIVRDGAIQPWPTPQHQA